ncbi:TetR/AcrR family transcriptional regulator [Micromonospora sp. NBC_01813]|uniref:TetR/AcrR family transcriptional regulator n=1 Tax=Micromonospora sp. NBC_01813 TaxID=2975988 RepID=UPI002DDBD985|nr:hypothetical protein [Micromonospora sp. NBC_01813]WSA10521.1 hypothetical protein OG958_06965 [Micromonospora sp. NBC_01813]
MLYAAFSHLAYTQHACFDRIIAELPDGEDLRERVVELIVTHGGGYGRDMVLSAELYALAVRDERYRALIQNWMERSRASLARYFPPELAPMIDALQEGLVLHSLLALTGACREHDSHCPAQTRRPVHGLLRDRSLHGHMGLAHPRHP